MANTSDTSSVAVRILAGALAGASETFVTYPAEFCKTRRQLHQHHSIPPSSFRILSTTYAISGFRGVYAGCGALAVSNSLKSGVRFLSFETYKDCFDVLFKTAPGNRSPWINVLSGLCAGMTEGLLVVTPGEALKTKIIHDAASGGTKFGHKGLLGAAGAIIKHDGVLGLWGGLTPVLLKQGTNSAVRFTTFATLKESIEKYFPWTSGSVGSTLLAGAGSGVVTVYASMPFDNIKTRLQRVDTQYRSTLDCAVDSLRNEGALAFWRGTSPRLVRLTLSSGITFAVYDQVIQVLKSFR